MLSSGAMREQTRSVGKDHSDEARLTATEPRSLRRLTDALGGDQASGAQRNNLDAEVDAAVEAFFDTACDLEGEERATVLTLRLVARDPTYKVPEWFKKKLAIHREACEEEFHRPDHGRAHDGPDHGRSDDDDADAVIATAPATLLTETVGEFNAMRHAHGISVQQVASALCVPTEYAAKFLRSTNKRMPATWLSNRALRKLFGQ